MVDANDFMNSLLDDPAVRAEYERQRPQFELHKEFLRARKRAKMDQKAVAQRMGTTDTVIARMESPRAKSKPSWSSIERFAAATGHRARLIFEPLEGPPGIPVASTLARNPDKPKFRKRTKT